MSSAPFKEMAERIEKNAEKALPGPIVICRRTAMAKSMLILNPQSRRGEFWGTVKDVVDMALAEIAQQQAGQFQGRR